MEDFGANNFCFGSLYGVIAVIGIATITNKMREARGRMASKDRTLNNFPASAQTGLTASSIVRNSRQAALTYYMLAVGLAVFIGLMLAVAVFVF